MGDRNISQPSAADAAERTSGQDVQDHALTMASRKNELLGELSEIEKSLAALCVKKKSISKELGTLLHSRPKTTLIPNSTVIDGSPNHEAVNPYPSSPMVREHASMTLHPGEARTVYLFVAFGSKHPNAIYEVKFRHGGVSHEPTAVGLVAEFNEDFCYQAARLFNRAKLYCYTLHSGYVVDTNSLSRISSIPSTLGHKSMAMVVSAYDKIYCVARPCPFSPPEPSFERYDPDKNIWEKMESFPFYKDYRTSMDITGYAVCHGVILLSLYGAENKNLDFVAYNLSKNQWNRVKVHTGVYYAPFQGRAVVVGKTIYSAYEGDVIALSLKMQKGDDGGIAYSLRQRFILQGLEIACPPLPFELQSSDSLVHLGKLDFCHVKTGYNAGLMVQHLCITTFQIVVGEGGRDMIKTIHSTVHSVDMGSPQWFDLVFCFARDSGDYEPTEEESNWVLQKEAEQGMEETGARKHEIGSDGQVHTLLMY